MRYNIPVENIEELRKQATRIQKKAENHGCEIIYKEVGEFTEEVEDEERGTIIRKYIVVEAEGEAKVNGWVFAGTIEHTAHGNILRSISNEHKIPERYKDAEPYCEHCHTKRARKDTYVVFNEETGEFKQVGKSCLKEYTNGLSLEMAAMILQWLSEVEKHCNLGSGISRKEYFDVKNISKYFVETMRKYGWANSSWGADSTKSRAMDFYRYDRGACWSEYDKKRIKNMIDEVDFDKNHTTDEYIESALNWAKSWDNKEWNDYRENLRIIANMDCCEYRHLGYLASLYMAYDKEMEREIKKMERAKTKADSAHIGQVGDKVSENIKEWKCLTAWDTQWGTTFMYEFTTEDGNLLIWKTGKFLDEEAEFKTVSGTIKAHNEFRGVKQTELTRCKLA